MTFRDRVTGTKEEQSNHITFKPTGDWVNVSYNCNDKEMVNFLYNIVDIANGIMDDEEFPEEMKKEIRKQWKKDLSGKDKEC